MVWELEISDCWISQRISFEATTRVYRPGTLFLCLVMHTVHTYIIYIYTHKHGYHKPGMWTRAHGARVVTTIMLENTGSRAYKGKYHVHE